MRSSAATLVAVLLASSACGGESEDDRGTVLRVFAASSLTEAFAKLERTYEQAHPEVDVQVSYDSSSTLAQQVLEGAPADVLATADEQTMATVSDKGLVANEPVAFATNTLTLVTPPDDPGGVSDLADLESDDVTLAVCVPQAPCGQAAQALLALEDVRVTPTTEQENVKSVLTQVLIGQVDAGLVYVTDAQAAGNQVRIVPVDSAYEVVSTYPVAVLADADSPAAAQEWVDLVTSPAALRVLSSYGFGPPA